MDRKIILVCLLMLLWDVAYPQVIVEHPPSDTLRYKVSLNNKWEEIVNMYLRETNSFKKDDGVISFEYCNDDGKETFVIGGIGTRKTLMQRIPSFYSLISDQVILIYIGVEDKVQYSSHYIDELYKVSFPRLYDNVSEITWRDPSRPNFKPVHGGISYDVEMRRIEMKDGKIVKKEITNTFLYSNNK